MKMPLKSLGTGGREFKSPRSTQYFNALALPSSVVRAAAAASHVKIVAAVKRLWFTCLA
jgi:hypothetical protein